MNVYNREISIDIGGLEKFFLYLISFPCILPQNPSSSAPSTVLRVSLPVEKFELTARGRGHSTSMLVSRRVICLSPWFQTKHGQGADKCTNLLPSSTMWMLQSNRYCKDREDIKIEKEDCWGYFFLREDEAIYFKGELFYLVRRILARRITLRRILLRRILLRRIFCPRSVCYRNLFRRI